MYPFTPPFPKKYLRVQPNDPEFRPDLPKPRNRKGGRHYFGGTVWWNECGRKRAHFDEVNAIAAQGNTPRKKGYELNAYFCCWCDWWHVGHKWIGGPI